MKYDLSSYFEDPEFKESLAKYEGMVESHTPAYFDADELTDIAEYYAIQGKEKEADKAIDLALRLHPNDTNAMIFRARSLALKGKMEEAYMVIDLIEDSSDREVKFLHAALLLEEQRVEEAEQIFQQLAASEDYALDTLLDIITEYIDANQEKYADQWLVLLGHKFDFTTLEKQNQDFRDVLCDFYTTFNKPDMAIPLLRMSLDQDPYSLHHWTELGRCHLHLGNYEEAHEAFDFALAIDDNDWDTLTLKAFTFKQSGNLQEAIRIYKQQRSLNSDSRGPIQSLVKAYLETKEYKLALPELIDLLDLPTFSNYEKAELYVDTAICLAGLGKGEAALPYIQKSREYNENDSQMHVRIGRYFLLFNNNEAEAVSSFNLALEKTPADERYDIVMNIATTCFDEHNFKLAATYFEQLNHEFPDEAKSTYYFLVYSYFYLQQINPCMHYLAKIKKEIPEMYADLGTTNAVTTDKHFNNMLCELKENIANGKIDLNKYL